MKKKKYQCLCCGYYTINEGPGLYEICPVCFWEDDPIQRNDEEFWGGANVPSLREARMNYKKYGACDENGLKYVRPPLPDEMKPGGG